MITAFVAWKIRSLSNWRWRTLATRLGCILTIDIYPSEIQVKLHQLIKLILEVYVVNWFEIMGDSKCLNQQIIERIKKQLDEKQNIVFKIIQYNAFSMLPENVFFSMMKSDKPEVKKCRSWKKISIRGVNIQK